MWTLRLATFAAGLGLFALGSAPAAAQVGPIRIELLTSMTGPAAATGEDQRVAARWRGRFLAQGIEGLLRDAPRPGRPRKITAEQEAEVARVTLAHMPPAATHWSTRRLARHLGINKDQVQRIWQRHGLKPHRVKTFKLSKDKRFVEKLIDIVGLYLNPPEHALVLCCDEKSQIQALNRTQPGLPLKKGRSATMTHDYKRHGTTLFAALNALTGQLTTALCLPRHRHQEWLRFLRQLDRDTPPDLGSSGFVKSKSVRKFGGCPEPRTSGVVKWSE